MATLWVQNLAAHWLQVSVLVGAAAAATAALRVRHPGVRLVLWQTILGAALVLPLVQQWQLAPVAPELARSAVLMRSVMTAPAAEGIAAPAWPSAILIVIAAGILLRLVWIAVGLRRMSRLRKLPAIEAERVPELDAAMRELGVRASLRFGDACGPLSFGAIRAVIVVPSAFLSLADETRRAVALHEAIHIRRRDWIAALAEEIALALLWFHPWSWWVRAQIRLAREEAVDREVVGRLGARQAYAACLLSMAGYDVRGTYPGVAMLRPRELRHRLDALFQEVAMSRRRLAVTIGLLVGVLAGAAAAAAAAFPLTTIAGAGGEARQEATRRVLQLVPPDYPASAQAAGTTGTVRIEVTVNAAGDVSGFNVTGGPAALHDATRAAVRQWKFERGRTADVLVVEVGYQLTFRSGRRIPGWSFSVHDRNAAGPLHVGGDVKAPRVTKEVKAVYPPDVLQKHVEGSVHLNAVIGTDGKVTDVEVLQSLPELDAAAIDAVRQWEFEPGTRNGIPVEVVVTIEIRFTLK